MAKIKKGDTVVIEATVSLVSKDGSEVTIRIPHHGYPVKLPINSVSGRGEAGKGLGAGAKGPYSARAQAEGKLAKLLGD